MKAYIQQLLAVALLALCMGSLKAAPTPWQAAFEKGNEFYAQEHYAQAIEQYLQALQSGHETWEVFFNIGNAYYRSGNYPQAILYYERAARRSHRQEDVAANLQLAESKIADRFEQMPQFFATAWWNRFVGGFSATAWGILLLCLFALLLTSLGLYFLSQGYAAKKSGFYLILISLILFCLCSAAAVDSHRQAQLEYAIVMQNPVDAKSSPEERSQTKFSLHEGSKVLIEDRIGAYCKVRIKNGSRAWVPEECLEKI